MRITMLALGSRGDVIPYATLGRALHEAGHAVRFATFENFQELVAGQGLTFHPVRGDMQEILTNPAGNALAEAGRNPLRMALALRRMFGTMARSFAEDFSDPALRECDLVISQLPGGMFGYDLAQKAAVPLITAAVMPLTPTRHEPMLAFPAFPSWIPGYNRLTYRLAYQLAWQGFRAAINSWRIETLHLNRVPYWGYSRWMDKSFSPVIYGISQHVVRRPPDWGEHIYLTGYWYPEPAEWEPPEELRQFIEKGSAPVFVGFGSMPVRDPEGTTKTVLEAIELCGCRAILHTGWAGIGDHNLPAHVYQIDYAPYEWLFPRMAAIAHHGGAGTTAYALRSGVPSFVVPFVFDQFYWGRRIVELGVGPPAVPFSKLTAERLAGTISKALNNQAMRDSAAALGSMLSRENGTSAAVGLIERLGT